MLIIQASTNSKKIEPVSKLSIDVHARDVQSTAQYQVYQQQKLLNGRTRKFKQKTSCNSVQPTFTQF